MSWLVKGLTRILFNLQNAVKAQGVVEIVKNILVRRGNKENKLLNEYVTPNKRINFPLPKYFSNGEQSNQKLTMVMKQVYVLSKPATKDHQKALNETPREKQFFQMLKFLDSEYLLKKNQIQDMQLIAQVSDNIFNYNFQQEAIFGEVFINGEHPYSIKDYNWKKDYAYCVNEKLEKKYQAAIRKAFCEGQEILDEENLNEVGLKADQIKQLLTDETENNGLYCSFFEDLEAISQGKTIVNQPIIHFESDYELKSKNGSKYTTYLQVPYAVFLKVKKENKEAFICIAMAFRYNEGKEEIKVFSPFFASQKKYPMVWQLARAHAGLVHINDFNVRVHLGIYHFTTCQYNLPFYNYLKKMKVQAQAEKLKKFYYFALEAFNKGLEGVNVGAISLLVHENPPASLVNNVFSLKMDDTIKLLSQYSSSIDMNSYNCNSLIEHLHLQKLSEDENNELYYDKKLFKAISTYIQQVYEAFGISQFEQEIIKEINDCGKGMQISGYEKRTEITNLLSLFQNLAYCWVVGHNHTFANVALATYYAITPGMLCQELKPNSQSWATIKESEYLPPFKVQMEAIKGVESTTQRDPENILIDVIGQLKFQSVRLNNTKVEKAAAECIEELEHISEQLTKINRKRHSQQLFRYNWLIPGAMQSSLNI